MTNSFKVGLALMVIAGFFIFLPQLFALSFRGLDFSFGSSNLGTLSVRNPGLLGALAVSYDSGNTFVDGAVFDLNSLPTILTIANPADYSGGSRLNKGVIYAGTNQGLLVSKDGGGEWYPYLDLEKNIDSGTYVNGFAVVPAWNAIYASAYKNNQGVIFETKDNFFSAEPIWSEAKISVNTLLADANYLYVGVNDGRLLRYSFVDRTFKKIQTFGAPVKNLTFAANPAVPGAQILFVTLTNGTVYSGAPYGTTFTAVTSGSTFFTSGLSASQFRTDQLNTKVVYLASASAIYRSVNQGESWTALNTVLPQSSSISSLAVRNGAIYVTTASKLYKSADGGATWTVIEPIPTAKALTPVYVSQTGNLVIVGTR